jgi:hypothetical protein
MDESLAKAAVLEFKIHCRSTEEKPAIAALNKWTHLEPHG